MVLPFAPRSNGSDPCDGVVAYNSARPPRIQALVDLNLAIFIIASILQAGCIWGHWVWREKPRFRKVRPIYWSVLLLVNFTLYQVSAFLSYTVALPCAVLVLFYMFALGSFGTFVSLRSITITIEASYAKATRKEETLFHDEQASVALSTSPTSTGAIVRSTFADFALVGAVAYGLTRVTSLPLPDLVILKNSHIKFAFILSIPSWAIGIVLVASIPAFQMCYDCDAFLELPIGITVSLVGYVLLTTKHAFAAFSAVGWDDHGVVSELILIPTTVGGIAIGVWALVLVDPDGIAYKRQFNWSLLFAFTTFLWLIESFAYQFYIQAKHEHRRAKLEIIDMDSAFSADPALKQEFQEFATRHYVIESLQFIEDVKVFKKYFFEKAENWKLAKFKSLTETYVLQGAKMEVNLGHATRSRIIKIYNDPKGHEREFYDCFDSAVHDVRQMIHEGAWTRFLIKKSRQTHGTSGQVIPATKHLS